MALRYLSMTDVPEGMPAPISPSTAAIRPYMRKDANLAGRGNVSSCHSTQEQPYKLTRGYTVSSTPLREYYGMLSIIMRGGIHKYRFL